MLLELIDDVIGDGVTLVLGQRLLEAAHDLAGAALCSRPPPSHQREIYYGQGRK